MSKAKKTKKEYEEYLNEIGMPDQAFWWVKTSYFNPLTYGSQLRRHDPIAFQVGFDEWTR